MRHKNDVFQHQYQFEAKLLLTGLIIGCFMLITQPFIGASFPKDVLYLPRLTGTVMINGDISEDAWLDNQCNYFTFGSLGFFEVGVYGFYKSNDAIFLAFRIYDDTQYSSEDKLIVGIDPTNQDSPRDTSSTNKFPPRKLQITRNNFVTLWKYDGIAGTYIQENLNNKIQSKISESTTGGYWQVELAIYYLEIGIKDLKNIGLYFLVIDTHSRSSDKQIYYWPVDALPLINGNIEVPLSDHWASGYCLDLDQTAPRPDLFFNQDELFTLNPGNQTKNYTVECGGQNLYKVAIKLRNNFLTDDNATPENVVFHYAAFGAGCFNEIGTVNPTTSILPNGSAPIEKANWTPACIATPPFEITLRAEQHFVDDAISSNNVIINNMKWLKVAGGDSFDIPMTVINCAATAERLAGHSHQLSPTSNPIPNRSLIRNRAVISGWEAETIYLHLNRTGLDSSAEIGKNWNIGFTPLTAADSLYPNPDSSIIDLFHIPLRPDSSSRFFVSGRVPASVTTFVPWPGWLIETLKLKFVTTVLNLPLPEPNHFILPQINPYLGATPSTLKITIYKPDPEMLPSLPSFRIMQSLTTVTIHLLTPLKLHLFGKTILSLLNLGLVASNGILIRSWYRRRWDWKKYLLTGLIVILLLYLIYLIIVWSQVI
ncbi:hypothetical protein L0128_11705 [candidate division KSB1 bacterium]|nr:hypothetical protein [candidate division KSB1 bacterium]